MLELLAEPPVLSFARRLLLDAYFFTTKLLGVDRTRSSGFF
jgi:hypothetical protein